MEAKIRNKSLLIIGDDEETILVGTIEGTRYKQLKEKMIELEGGENESKS